MNNQKKYIAVSALFWSCVALMIALVILFINKLDASAMESETAGAYTCPKGFTWEYKFSFEWDNADYKTPSSSTPPSAIIRYEIYSHTPLYYYMEWEDTASGLFVRMKPFYVLDNAVIEYFEGTSTPININNVYSYVYSNDVLDTTPLPYRKEPINASFYADYCNLYNTTNFNTYVFNSKESAESFAQSGDLSGLYVQDNSGSGNEVITDLPTPQVKVESGGVPYQYSFINGSPDYYVEVQGRYTSVDDMICIKNGTDWSTTYETKLIGNLETWVTYSDRFSSESIFDLSAHDNDGWNIFLQKYPIESRTIQGGTNSLGNIFSGFNNYKNIITLGLKNFGFVLNGHELFFRYWYQDDNGVLHNSPWNHVTKHLPNARDGSGENKVTQSNKGLSDDDKNEIVGNGSTDFDETPIIQDYTDYLGTDNSFIGALNYIRAGLNALRSFIGDFSLFLKDALLFIPQEIIYAIGACFTLFFAGAVIKLIF